MILPRDPALRLLALGALVNRAGTGAIMTTLVLYFTRIEALPATRVGLALSAGAVVAMIVQVPLGHLGDALGPPGMLSTLQVLTGVFTAGLVVTHSIALLVPVISLVLGAQAGAGSVRNGYIARIAVGSEGVHFRAYLRAVTNLAMGLGTLLGGVALWIDQTWAYLAVFVMDASFSVLTGLISLRLPAIAKAPPRGAGEPMFAVLRDPPYVVVTLLTGIVAIHFQVLAVGIPLWISTRTQAPPHMVAVILLINTIVVTLFQVRASRAADTVANAAVASARGGACLAAAFCIWALSTGVDATKSVVLLVLGAGVHVVGEMLTSGGQWGTTMGLAPQTRQGQYQGFAGLGFALSNVIGPALIAWLCVDHGQLGWLILAAMVLLAGILTRPACAWAARTRERYGAATASG